MASDEDEDLPEENYSDDEDYYINWDALDLTLVNALGISICIIAFTCLVAMILRKLIKKNISDNFLKMLLNEAVASAELCACCFELIIVADNFGVTAYAICLFLLTIWWSKNWEDAAACPYIHIENAIKGEIDFRTVLQITWAELLGGVIVFRYVQFLWNLGLAETHKDRAYEKCTADLQVSMLLGAIIECLFTCLCRLASKVISEKQPRFATAIDSLIGTLLVVAAFNYSGGYFNPVLATALKFGCAGNTLTEHLIVYWFGSIFGSILSITVYNSERFQKLAFGPDKIKTKLI